jgi:anionic cell wall polymer biosynthesis LytR-Cps2A-Psr (LCP) family protein
VPKNVKRIDPSVFVILGIIAVLVSVTTVILVNVRTDRLTSRLEQNPQLPLVLMISDEQGLISTQLLLIDSNTGNLASYDFPRRLGAIIPALGRVDRIDNLYDELGPEELVNTLANIVNMDIEFYLDLSLSDIEVITDLIEGVTVFLPLPIEDDIDGRRLLIPGGNVLLDGESVAEYVAYEGADERELEWISRRWTFLREFIRSISEYQLLYQNDQLRARLVRHLEGNFDADSASALVDLFPQLQLEAMITQRVLGNERQVETSIGEQNILFPHFEGQLVRDSISQVLGSLGAPEAAYTAALSTRIEVLNGTEINGLAARTRDLYQNFGFEVLRIGNADRNDYDATVIIDRAGNPEIATRVGELIRAENVEEGSPLADNPEVDVTIILGSDFDGWYVNAGSAE